MSRRLISLALVALLTGVAGLAFHRVFAWRDLVPLVAVAAAVPALLAAVASRWRPPLNILTWVLVTSATLFHSIPTPRVIAVEGGGVRDAWKGILTTILPAPPRPDLLVGIQVVTWIAAFAGAEIALRTRTRVAPATPAFGVFVLALFFGVDGPGSNLPIAAALVLLTACLALVRAGRPLRALTLGLPVAAGLTATATVVGPLLPFVGTRPFDPREHVATPPPLLRSTVNPLDEVSAWLQYPDTPLFSVRASAPENWRLAVLDRFDGAIWSSGARFIPSGSRVPPGAGRHATTRVRQTITVQELTGAWLPAADRPAQVTGVGMATDPRSGVLVAAQPLRPGQNYRVTSEVPQYTDAELGAAVPPGDAEARADLALPPGAGTVFAQYARAATAGASFPFQQALRLADYLRIHELYDPSISGHAYRNLAFFLTDTHRGASEQFATSYAVMARTLGLPSRVVVGFRPGSAANGVWQVRSGDVLVWPEIDFAGLGWVPFYPTPDAAVRSTDSQPVPAGESAQRLKADQKINTVSRGIGGQPPTPRPRPVRTRPVKPPEPLWLIMAAVTVAVIAGYVVAIVIVPALRTAWRRQRATAAGRIEGAWQTTVERLRDGGLPVDRAMTAHEIASLGGDALERHLDPLADIVNWAGFAPIPPSAPMADEAWRLADAVRSLVHPPISRRLHPRSLIRRQSGTAPRMHAGRDQATADGLPKATTAPTVKQ